MPTFDERPPKYRHCCCHIRVAAYVIGILELLSVLYILAQHSIRSIIADVQQSDADKHHADSSTPASPSSGTKRWLGPGATTPLVTWAVCETLFLGLMFYGIARTRPWLLIPQLFLQIITIIVCMILNILMVCVLAWHPYVTDIWYFLASTVVFAFLYEYGLVVMIRCYRYLRDKAAYDSQTTHGIFVLPTRANGEIIVTANEAALMESRMYSDLPPEYATAIAMMTVDEANKPSTTTSSSVNQSVPSEETKTETASDSSRLRHESEKQPEQEAKGEEHQSDENAPPPTYEEARQLQRARTTSVSTNQEEH